MMDKKSVVIFSKVPLPGLVKTRLVLNSVLNENETALLAEAMLKDTILLSAASNADRIDIGYYPKKNLNNLKEIVNDLKKSEEINQSIYYHLQNGANFDERFCSIVNSVFKKTVESLIVLGADLPYLNPNLINNAFNKLSNPKKKNLLVIGPSTGGGIYLVGLKKSFHPSWFPKHKLFRGGIEIYQFIAFSKLKGLNLFILPPLGDIDLEEDLVSLMTYIDLMMVSDHRSYYHYPKYTSACIKALGLRIKESNNNTRNRKIEK